MLDAGGACAVPQMMSLVVEVVRCQNLKLANMTEDLHCTLTPSLFYPLVGLPSGEISPDLSQAAVQRLGQCKDGFFLASFIKVGDGVVSMDVQDPDTKEDIAEASGLVKPKVKGHKVSDMTFRTIHLNTDTEFVITEAVSPGEFYGFSPSENESKEYAQILLSFVFECRLE